MPLGISPITKITSLPYHNRSADWLWKVLGPLARINGYDTDNDDINNNNKKKPKKTDTNRCELSCQNCILVSNIIPTSTRLFKGRKLKIA